MFMDFLLNVKKTGALLVLTKIPVFESLVSSRPAQYAPVKIGSGEEQTTTVWVKDLLASFSSNIPYPHFG